MTGLSLKIDDFTFGRLLLRVSAAEVSPVFFVFFAGIRQYLGVLAFDRESHGPGLGIKLGVIEGDCPLQIVLVNLLKTLHEMQLIAVLVAGGIEPGAIVEPDRIND